ncbi:MAG TPA: hypothetical protein VGO47_05140 [Chlamydiales bacterium]|nr:hypothetical protein [Chlamydiales bacterium]
MSVPPPTHVFAVYAKASPRVFLHSAHAVVLAANCAHLPLLPASKTDSTTSTASTTLPVVPLRIPNPATFPTLLHYLYTKRANHLLAALLPLTLGTPQSLQHLSQHLAATYTLPVLLTHAARVHGLWSNVVALGVFDDGLWKAIDMSWQVLLGAVASSTGAQWQTNQKS